MVTTMKTGKKNNADPMFLIFLLLSAICIGVSAYTGMLISKAENVENGMVMLQSSSLLALALILMASMISVVLCGFASIKVYSGKAAQANKANEAKTQFFSRMSHDMRTPMSAIIGLCRMAYESDDMSEIKNYLETINTSSLHLLNIVNDVLDISRIESGKLQLDNRPIDIHDEINKIVGIMVPDIEENSQDLNVIIDPEVPKYLICDGTHLRQVLVNLISNASKFTREEGRIELSVTAVEQTETRVKLLWHVKDNGIGMDKVMAAAIFTPFDMGSGKTTFEYSGTGLGLPIASQLVHMMGGEINVDSEMGRGSDFYFNIWVDISSYEEYLTSGASKVSYAVADLSGKNVLVFEDIATNRMIAENVLSKMGARIEFALNGLQGVNMFLANPQKYDLIFMDIKMPVMDGYEATGQIRRSGIPEGRTIPIIAMTANAFKEDAARALNEGMNAHVGKPFDIADVERALLEANVLV